MISQDNKIINGLWVGNKLSHIEILTLKSFIYHGHDFHLWVYEEIDNVPEDVILKDANQIIPEKDIIVRKYNDPVTGVGKGSVGAPFSDMFRYKLLYEHGGWWVDLDVTCLKPLQFEEPYFFRNHLFLDVIGNVMKCPKGSELMLKTYREVKETCDENTLDWLLPNKTLGKYIKELGLMKYVRSGISNLDEWPETKRYIRRSAKIPESWYLIHWMNEEWRMNGIDKNHLRKRYSTLGDLLKEYDVKTGKVNLLKAIRNDLKLAKPINTRVIRYGTPGVYYRVVGLIKMIFYYVVRRPFNKVYWYFHGHVKYYWDKYLLRK
jgi:hypothetical protein